MTNSQKQSNQRWFESMCMFLNDGGHLIVPMLNEVYIFEKGKIKPQTFAGMVAIKKVVTEEWFDEKVLVESEN